MKKLKTLLSLLMLSGVVLTGCNKDNSGDGNTPSGETPSGDPSGGDSRSSTLSDAVATLESISEYKVTAETLLYADDFPMQFGPSQYLNSKFRQTSHSEEVYKGNEYFLDMSLIKNEYTNELKLSEVMAVNGITDIEFFKTNVLPEMEVYMGDCELDEANDSLKIKRDMLKMDSTQVYFHIGTNGEQSRYALYQNGKLSEATYVPNYYTKQEQFAMDVYLSAIKEHLSSATQVGEKYTIDMSASPVVIMMNKLTKISLKWDSTSYTIEAEGSISESGSEMKLETKAVISNIGSTGLVVPEYEIVCPNNHAKRVLAWYSEEGHCEACAVCGKYLSDTPTPHEHSELHDQCLLCEYENIYDEPYLDEKNLFSDGTQIFDLAINKSGTVYSPRGEEIETTKRPTFETTIVDEFDFEDQLEVTRAKFVYYDEEKIFGLVEFFPEVKLTDTCRSEFNSRIYVFRNARITLTEEQQQKIDENPESEEEVYWEALGEVTKFSDLTAKFGTEYQRIEVSSLVHLHFYAVDGQINIDDCNYILVYTCSVCHYSPNIQHWQSHDLEYVIITPEWGDADYTYYIEACKHCDYVDGQVYAFKTSDFVEHETPINIEYYYNGKKGFEYPGYVPHIDTDHNGKCDLCHEDMPEE